MTRRNSAAIAPQAGLSPIPGDFSIGVHFSGVREVDFVQF